MKKLFEEMDNDVKKLYAAANKVCEHKMPKIKPCPFCGGKPVLLPGSVVECMTVDCPMHPDYVMTVDEWNKRA